MKIRCLGCMAEYEKELGLCPYCGYELGAPAESALHMQPGAILADRYSVGRVIGFGGFGVTYIGWDHTLHQKVAIKEYLPSEFATRAVGQTQVTVFGGNKAEQFAGGMVKFVEEAKRLAQFQNELGIVRVFDSFEDNNTAYIVMEYLDGETLTAYLGREGKIPAERAIEMLTPVIRSLEAVHKAGIIHRDIAPDNIMITKDGQVKLIDFGAARYATTSHSRSLTVIIKPGYSPEEQYRSRGDQGPHTDVYALGAVLYRMVTGVTPPDALERRAYFENKKKNILTPPSKNCKLSKSVENAILNAMNVRIEDRTKTAAAFLDELTSVSPVARVAGKIKAIDLMKWPLWAKIVVPLAGAAVAALFALLLTGKIGFTNHLQTDYRMQDQMTRVPSVVNFSVTVAQDKLEAQSLKPIIAGRETSDTIPANLVLRQSLDAGGVVEKWSAVDLFVSAEAEPVIENETMPDISFYAVDEATEILRKLGAAVAIEEVYSSDVRAGIVIYSNVGMGDPLMPGDPVTLYVSKGPDPALAAQDTPGQSGEPQGSGQQSQQGNAPGQQGGDQTPVIPALQLNRSTISLMAGETTTLQASGGDGRYSWSSSDPSVVSVSNGSISALKKGNATITVSSAGQTAKCPVVVNDYSLSLSNDYISLFAGESQMLYAFGAPAGATVVWSTSRSGVATVSNGRVSAVGAGEAVITAQFTSNGRNYSASCNVRVSNSGITLSQYSISNFYVGDTKNLSATTSPSGQNVSWSSSRTSVATVDNWGRVAAVGKGDATITASFTYGGSTYTERCSVTVSDVSVSIPEANIDLIVGGSERLYPSVSPYGADVSWGSDDTRVVRVDSDGNVRAVGKGAARVTVTVRYDGRTASDYCMVHVTQPGITLSQTALSLDEGESKYLRAITTPSGSSVTWRSSDNDVARVDSDGEVHGKAGGNATITAKITVDGKEYSESCSVSVASKAPSINLGWVHVWMDIGDQDTVGIMDLFPSDATVTWKSSDSSIVSVNSSGRVTALKPGEVTITATASNGGRTATDTCQITVEGSTVQAPTGYSISASSSSAYFGEDVEITIKTNEDCDRVILYYSLPNGHSGSHDVSNCVVGSNRYRPTFSFTNTNVSGEWKFYAEVSNSAGTYSGSTSKSYCTVRVSAEPVAETAVTPRATPAPTPTPKPTPAPTREPTWGSWSSWQDTRVSETSTRQVETRQVESTPARTEYRYGRFVNSEPFDHFCPEAAVNAGHRNDFRVDYTSWSENQLISLGEKWICRDKTHNHQHCSSRGPSVDSWYGYKTSMGAKEDYYWVETRQVDATYKTQYRYRELS